MLWGPRWTRIARVAALAGALVAGAAGVGVAGLAGAGAGAAQAAESAIVDPAPQGTWISYAGKVPGTSVSLNATLICLSAGDCTIDIAPPTQAAGFRWVAIPTGTGTFTGTFPQTGDLCSPGSGLSTTAGSFSVAATAASATMIVDVDNREIDCGGGAVSYDDSTVVASFVAGSPCVLTGVPCPLAPTPTPTPTPVEASAATPTDPSPPATAAQGLVKGGSRLASGDAAAPSVLWQLPTLSQAPTAPIQLALAALVTIVLVLLVAFPTALLNSAVEAAPERFRTVTARFRHHPRHVPRGDVNPPSSDRAFSRTWWVASSGVLLAAVISAFVDPQFGFNAGSLRVMLGILAGFTLDVVLGWSVIVLVTRRIARNVTVNYRFAPLSLLVVVLAVLFTRLTGFEPGVVFGLVAGVAVGYAAERAVHGRIALALAGYALGVGVIGWVLYGALGPALVQVNTIWSAFAIDTLSSVAMAGVAASPIILMPLRGLAGGDLYQWSRGVWAVAYFASLAVFFFVLMPMPPSWADVSMALGTWITIYAAYAAAAVGIWLFITRPWRREEEGTPSAGAEHPVPSMPRET